MQCSTQNVIKLNDTKQAVIRQPRALLVIIGALLSAFYVSYLSLVGLFASVSFITLCFLFSFTKKSTVNTLLGFGIFIFCVALLLHLVPGFNNLLVIDQQAISSNAATYSQFINFDKAVVAFGLLVFVINNPPRSSNNNYRQVVTVILAAYVLAIVIGITSGLIAFEAKISQYWVLWGLINLFITCYAEEAFFRGFVQTALGNMMRAHKYKDAMVIVLSGSVFGLAHIPAGGVYSSIACLLGCAYAFAYQKTGNILVPILGHFFFNVIHFIFFTYPYLIEVQ